MRLFWGATLPVPTKNQIRKAQVELSQIFANLRIEGVDKLHITLQFMGDLSSDRVDELLKSVRGTIVAGSFNWQSVENKGISFFPNEKISRGIWIDCRDGGTLAAIAESIKSVTADFGIISERREFVPHITIGRFGRNRIRQDFKNGVDLQKLWSQGKLTIGEFFPVSVALFESKLKPSGSEYKIVSEISLETE